MPPPRWALRIGWAIHRFLWATSGGRLGSRAVGLPVLELVTTGRRSGEPRTILIGYVESNGVPVVAGTNAGANRDPAWALNLRADPAARVRRNGRWDEVSARFIEGEDWERVWEDFLPHPGYADYRRMTERRIPLIALEPVRR